MEFPPEHYQMEKCEEEILGLITDEDILWTFEYHADLTQLTEEELASMNALLNIRDGVTLFYSDGYPPHTPFYLDYDSKSDMLKIETDHNFMYADRVALKRDGIYVSLYGFVGEKTVFDIRVGELDQSQHRFDFLKYEYTESIN